MYKTYQTIKLVSIQVGAYNVFSFEASRFTKWRCVRGKNTQKLKTAYLIELFSLNMNMNSILKLIQRFRIYFNFLIFQELFLINFFVYLTFSSNCRKFYHQESRNRKCEVFVFIVLLTGEWRSKSYSKWKMTSIWRTLDGF